MTGNKKSLCVNHSLGFNQRRNNNSYVSLLMQIFSFCHNLAILLFSQIVLFYD